jgi:ubiquinone/menaquinone biosynthesis C-methylase UbiE
MSVFNKLANNNNSESLSYKFRKQRFEIFLNVLRVKTSDKILDIGGTEAIWIDSGLEKQVTLLNIQMIQTKNDKFKYVVGDACDLKFADGEYDIVYSNSVIEHVGNFARQTQFAKEVIRVGKSHWIQTPYKHFPIEPHFLFPLFQYFPPQIQRYIGMKWNYSHLKRNSNDIIDELTRLRLISLADMNKLFPQSNILKEKYYGLIKSIIAYKQ